MKNVVWSFLVALSVLMIPIKKGNAALIVAAAGVPMVVVAVVGGTSVIFGGGIMVVADNKNERNSGLALVLTGIALDEEVKSNAKIRINYSLDLQDRVAAGLLTKADAKLIFSDMQRLEKNRAGMQLNIKKIQEKSQAGHSLDQLIAQIAVESKVHKQTVRYLLGNVGIQ